VTIPHFEGDVGAGTRSELALQVDVLPDGSTIDVPVTVVRGARPGPRVVIIAGVHGDEFVGPLAVGRLSRELDPLEVRGTVLLLPIVNRPAFRSIARNTPVDGLNLNRTFPGRPDGIFTERLAHALTERIVRGADALVDLHGGGMGQRFMPVVGCRPDLAGLGLETCRMAAAFGWEFLWGMPPVSGVLSYEACRLGVPSVGVEVGGQGSVRAAEVELELAALKRLLRYLGSLPGASPVPHDAQPAQLPPVLVGDRTFAPASGLFVPAVEVGQRVAEDEALGIVWAAGATAGAEVRAPRSGVVVALTTVAPVLAGDFVALVLGPGVPSDHEAAVAQASEPDEPNP
jgi:uncharacterized protein